ncbi:hypothetical protein [Mycobacterium sp. 94-17]|uniref:hypothetical protein n=1 Tax=Mycobacterium sp. 94-17 TaxID=2986147 RepID=UPI002D1EE934|nr:hypothetical protein [Mycobacterium sp. 94-17]MEB4208073.1 hypothetical protein [Mycobacterium sp. 94-17]
MAAIASAALTLLPWIDLNRLGLPFRWNGLGIYIGEHGEHYDDLLTGLVNSAPGWTVLVASLAAAGALLAATRVRGLDLVACGCAAVAFVSAVLCLVHPVVLAGDATREMGVSLGSEREVLNIGALIAEAAATGVLVVCTALVVARAKRTVSQPD